MEDRKLTERESLDVITAMIARTKERYVGSGNILLMWGYLVVAVSIVVWILIAATRQGVWNWLWFAIPLIGWPAKCVMTRKSARVSGATTYSDKITSRLWTIIGISEIILALICMGLDVIGGINSWSAMLVYSLLLVPAAEIAQGLIIEEKCMVVGGMIGLAVGVTALCCVAGGIPLLLNRFMPLFILAFAAMMIFPGHVLNKKACRR